jgi:hypothetical protein
MPCAAAALQLDLQGQNNISIYRVYGQSIEQILKNGPEKWPEKWLAARASTAAAVTHSR